MIAGDPAWSSAAELHRAGIHQVIAWLGPVGDAQCTRAEEIIYAALVRGRTAREAVREARQICRQPHRDGGKATRVYPLGWAQLALYHRGADVPVALPATAGGPDLGRNERRRVMARLNASRGPAGVERLKFGFVGRRSVRAEVLLRFREGARALVVQGLGGLGKTALCAEMAPSLAREISGKGADGKPNEVRVVALDGRSAGRQADPVSALWEQVQSLAEDDVWDAVLGALQRDGITGEALAGALLSLARREGGLLVYLDDAESLQVPVGEGELGAWRSPALEGFWRELLAAAGREPRFAVLASTRYVPAGLSPAALYSLPVMRDIDLVRLVPWWPALDGLRGADLAWLVSRIDGHPRSLQWLDGLARRRAEALSAPGRPFAGDLRRDVIERVLPERDATISTDLLLPWLIEAVGAEARAHLRRCAVLEEPAPWGALAALEGAPGTGKRLVEVGLLSAFEAPRGGEPLWSPHRMVAEAAGRGSREDEIEAHRRVGMWFRARWEEDQNALGPAAGAARHLCAAGEGDAAWGPARRMVLARRHAGRYREALGWVQRALGAGATGARRGVALAFEVQLGTLGGVAPAEVEARLEEALGFVGEEDQSFVLDELGKWYHHHGRLREAADALERSVALESKLKGEEHPDVAASLHELAGVLTAQGDLAGARERLERSLRIKATVFGTEEHPDVAASLHSLAGVLQGDLDHCAAPFSWSRRCARINARCPIRQKCESCPWSSASRVGAPPRRAGRRGPARRPPSARCSRIPGGLCAVLGRRRGLSRAGARGWLSRDGRAAGRGLLAAGDHVLGGLRGQDPQGPPRERSVAGSLDPRHDVVRHRPEAGGHQLQHDPACGLRRAAPLAPQLTPSLDLVQLGHDHLLDLRSCCACQELGHLCHVEPPVGGEKVAQKRLQRTRRVRVPRHLRERRAHLADLAHQAGVVPGHRQAPEHDLSEARQRLLVQMALLALAQIDQPHLEARNVGLYRTPQLRIHGDDLLKGRGGRPARAAVMDEQREDG
ncbi:MAG: tetratricopeptide repeat protein, partial [Polyangiaceae bacterium]|nr:tetratricopeptide repeat protein [Polyangiaceae bacterium]